ncbi:MAG: sugar kinase [Bacteroidetes bacterium]|jgi:2-dehydro-3-deoxygluconokinase|nr:sugar kinase [Bacteroidota bacterium]
MSQEKINKNYSGSVLNFGELLFRLSLDSEKRWLKENNVPFYIGGAELNVATALALWGIPAQYLTALPDNDMSAQITSFLNDNGIRTPHTYYHGNRVGLYFLTKGADLKNNSLIYDRASSAFAELKPGMIDWDKVLDGVSWFNFSAICPAINQNVADVCEEALIAASRKNITISIDLNYRAKLWQYGKQPHEVVPQLVKYCDLVMGNIWAAEKMLNIPVTLDLCPDVSKSNYLEASLKTSQEIIEKYPKCKAVANTFRFDINGGINYYTSLYTDSQQYNSTEYSSDIIINNVGSGDCFMAGLIYGFYNHHTPDQTLEFATLSAFDKLFIEGDTTNKTVEEIKNRLNESASA